MTQKQSQSSINQVNKSMNVIINLKMIALNAKQGSMGHLKEPDPEDQCDPPKMCSTRNEMAALMC
jgi:hypothetical protein